MNTTLPTQHRRRPGERGAALIVALVAVVALLGIGMVTMLAVRSDTSASASDRFQQIALYAAESGAHAGIDFLRGNCRTDNTFFSQYIGTTPSGITGNGIKYGQAGNPFTASPETYYSVSVKNNVAESTSATDTDGSVILHSVGYGPNNTQVTIEVEVSSPTCIASTCSTGDFAQKGNSSLGDSKPSVCNSVAVSSSGWRSSNVGGL
jgi:hypothetical protein